MKINKGIYQDTKEIDQPEGTAWYIKNMILNERFGSQVNEPGLLISSINIPYQVIGALTIDNEIVIFSTDNTNSAIGIYNPDTDTYLAVLDRTDLGFRIDKKITGETKRNFKGEIITVFTDNNVDPKYINLGTATNLQDIKDFFLFPISIIPIISLTSVNDNGGILTSGVYYIAVQYENIDGTVTSYSFPFGPTTINEDLQSVSIDQYDGCVAGTITSKSITYNISNIDTTYNNLIVAILSKINGVVTTRTIGKFSISGTSRSITYNGTEVFTNITNEEVLIPNPNYKTVKTLTQIQDQLHAANLSSNDIVKMQKFANNIVLNYISTLTEVDNLTDNSKLPTTNRGFMHDEVYAFYIHGIIKNSSGRLTPGFHIPGRDANVGDIDVSILASAENITAFKYQVEDTSVVISAGTGTGGTGFMSYWENATEDPYLNLEFDGSVDYNGNPIGGGRNLVGTKIKHHKFPSIATCKARHYNSDSKYGTTKLDRLGVNLSNWNIPLDIKDKLEGFVISYAKRSPNNSTVSGQSLLQYAGYYTNGGVEDLGKVWTTGGNWNIDDNDAASPVPLDQVHIDPMEYLRFYSFDLLKEKPQISPTYIRNELKLRKNNVNTEGNMSDGPDMWSYLIDYLYPSASSNVPIDSNLLRSVGSFKYMPHDSISNELYNVKGEEFISLKILLHGNTLGINVDTLVNDVGDHINTLTFEETYLTNLKVLLDNVFTNFNKQDLVNTNRTEININATSINDIYGGDTFIGEHSYVTFGPRNSVDTIGGSYCRFIHRFVCECISNVGLRHITDNDSTTYYYPKVGPTFINSISADNLSNQWGYNKDYSSVNDLSGLIPYDVDLQSVTKFPYRDIRSKKSSREEQGIISWKVFLPNDFYESVKNKGEIINIQGYGNDRLFIHHRDSLFLTRSKTKLQGDVLDVTLGTGDLFDLDPEELIPTKVGFAGTQHQLSCILSKHGYFFVDAEQGNIFLFNGSKPELITAGLQRHFRDNLNIAPIGNDIDNPYIFNGISVAYDEKYERFILSIKNINGVLDKSYTVSYYPESECWESFHDYMPDFILNTRSKTYSFKSSKLYTHNIGNRGTYYNNIIYPSFIDFISNSMEGRDVNGRTIRIAHEKNKLLEAITWITEVQDSNGLPVFSDTITEVTIRTNYQASGKITINKNIISIADLRNARNSETTWSFNEFRDIVKDITLPFTEDIYGNFNMITSNIDSNMSWFNKRKFISKYFVIRLEFSNNQNKLLYLHEADASVRESYR